MRVLLLFSLLSFNLFGQDTVQIKKIKNYFPWLGGRQTGELPYFSFCDEKGLWTLETSQIVDFDVTYSLGSMSEQVHVLGNVLPDSVCLKIGQYSLGSPVFIYNIRAVVDGEKVQLNSMQLIPIRKENE